LQWAFAPRVQSHQLCVHGLGVIYRMAEYGHGTAQVMVTVPVGQLLDGIEPGRHIAVRMLAQSLPGHLGQ
jgi:hypothetical protein